MTITVPLRHAEKSNNKCDIILYTLHPSKSTPETSLEILSPSLLPEPPVHQSPASCALCDSHCSQEQIGEKQQRQSQAPRRLGPTQHPPSCSPTCTVRPPRHKQLEQLSRSNVAQFVCVCLFLRQASWLHSSGYLGSHSIEQARLSDPLASAS